MTSAPARPAISVLLPVRDGLPYLERAITSLLDQTWIDFELLVIDDGSRDGTAEYVRQLTDPRIRVMAPRGSGLAAALNTGLAAARSDLIARQDADDWSAPTRLARQVAWMRAHPDIAVLASEVAFVDGQGTPVVNAWTRRIHEQWDTAVSAPAIAALMPLTCCLFHATVMARTSVLRAAGGYDPAMVPAEDYDLWLRLLPDARFARLSEVLYTVRVHDGSSSAIRKCEQVDRVIAAKLRYLRRQQPHLPWPATLALPFDDRGAAAFRRVAEAEGFSPLPGTGAGHAADVVAVTDFSHLDRWAAESRRDPALAQIGNLFVRTREGSTQARCDDGEAEAGAYRR